LLEVGAPATADEEAIARESHAVIVQHVREAPPGVTRRGPRFKVTLAERDTIAVLQQPVCVRSV